MTSGQVYKVKAGDTLSSIAKSVYGDANAWPHIAQANRLRNPDLIYVGSSLLIPSAAGRPAQPPPHAPVTPQMAASKPARHVSYPPVSYVLEKDLRAVELRSPGIIIKVALVGTITLELQKPLLEVDFRSNTVSGSIKAEYDSRLAQAVADMKASYNPSTKKLDVSLGLTTASKVGGQAFHFQEARLEPPNKLVYRSTPRAIEGKIGEMLYKGTISAVVEITVEPPKLQPAPIPVRQASFVLSPQGRQAVMFTTTVLLIAAVCISAPATTAVVASVVLVNFITAKRDMGYL